MICSISAHAQGQAADNPPFSHNSTGFVLEGAHVSLNCESCHIQGVFRGTPRDCASCHRPGGRAPGKPTSHVPTSANCDSCHMTAAWTPANFMHRVTQGITPGSCNTCHNGGTAPGKPATHVVTTASCDSCHKTSGWLPAGYSHALVTPGTCATCHNGSRATGKPATHIPTSTSCDACHAAGVAFAPLSASVSVMHASMTSPAAPGNCSTCHNGSFLAQNAQAKPSTHIQTSAQCDTCHHSTSTWATAVFRHQDVSPSVTGRCSTCHGVNALGKPTNHIPTTAQCDTCHNNFSAFNPALMDHVGTAGKCATCHNGAYTFANAQSKPVTHIPTSASCDTCHVGGFVNWAPATMDHTGTAGKCTLCHAGGYVSQNAQTKPATHIATNAQCDSCHRSTTTWATAVFNHAAASPPAAGRCSSCHNGANARGKPISHIPTGAQCDSCHTNFVTFSPAQMNHAGTAGRCSTCHNGSYTFANAQTRPANHIPSIAQCDTCHISGFSAWSPATMNHSGLAGLCSACHNGSYLAQNAQTKPATHVPTSAQCDTCHTSTTSWATAVYSHEASAYGQCSNCHNGALALGKPTNHIPTSAQCDTCHSNFLAFRPASMNHTGLAGQCTTCHSGAYAFVNAQAKPANHIPGVGQCDTCHINGFVAWSPSTMNHSGLQGTCSNCHNGAYLAQNAQTKPANHIPTSAQCDTCHSSTTTWATASFNHADANPPAPGRCASCHNGSAALGKPTNHIPTTAQCDTCHNGYIAFAPAVMNHAATSGPVAAGNCATCHGGGYVAVNALAKPATHIPTSQSCDVCHTSAAWLPTSFAHQGVNPGTCATCHNGSNALGKPSTHLPTSATCDACHTNYVAFAPATMNHARTSGPVAPGNCATCHGGSYVSINAQAKPATHVPTSAQCDSCHNSTVSWATATFNHAAATPPVAGRCASCHNGSNALGKPTNHIPTTAQCDTCHTNFTAFAPAVMSHAGTLGPVAAGNCASCHSGAYVAQNALSKPASHIPTSSQCDSCHTNGFVAWAPSNMNHAGLAGQCTTCHSGAYMAQNALAKPANHVITSAQCDTCHNSTTTWATGQFDHASANPPVVGRCSTCHGVNALGKPAGHIPTTAQCDTCHNNFSAFAPALMSHAGTTGPVAAGNCSTCHGGAYVAQNALAKPATHIVTSAQCDSCHNSTTSWATATFNHASATPPAAGRCATCHNGTTALGKPTNHIPTTAQCDTCHNGYVAFTPAVMNHAGTSGPAAAGNCATCHNGSYVAQNAQAKPATHIPTNQSCDVCHTTSIWLPTSFAHQGVSPGTCTTCHNGTNAVGKPALHIPTTQSCDICHRTGLAWLPLITPYAHTGIAPGSCATCHAATYPDVDVKPAGHVPTSAACDACHQSFSTWLQISYNHSGVAPGTCQTCHGGLYTGITKVPSNHIPTLTPAGMPGSECSLCHSSTVSFTTERMNHGTMQTSCATCHDSTSPYAGSMEKINRSRHNGAGSRDCSSSGCHRPLGSRGRPYTSWD